MAIEELVFERSELWTLLELAGCGTRGIVAALLLLVLLLLFKFSLYLIVSLIRFCTSSLVECVPMRKA